MGLHQGKNETPCSNVSKGRKKQRAFQRRSQKEGKRGGGKKGRRAKDISDLPRQNSPTSHVCCKRHKGGVNKKPSRRRREKEGKEYLSRSGPPGPRIKGRCVKGGEEEGFVENQLGFVKGRRGGGALASF